MNNIALNEDWDSCSVPRIGFAQLVRRSLQGEDLSALWNELMEKATDDAAGSGMGMDLSIIAQLRRDKETGLAIQRDTLKFQQIFRAEKNAAPARLRVLALAAASDIGANTPVEFLLEDSGVALATYYITDDAPLPASIPAHDIAIVVAPATPDGETALAAIESLAARWPRPILNAPAKIRKLERDRLYPLLDGVAGLHIPATLNVPRERVAAIASGQGVLRDVLKDGEFPIIIRPLGSHAGAGLAKIDDLSDLTRYLGKRDEARFFISPFVDYASKDGLFRKYRIALVGGQPYACHMAICDEWKIWHASAGMALSVPHRVEEAKFMEFFDQEFAARHRAALAGLVARIGLDYFVVDCAETREGALLIFEADNCAIVHDLDPPNVYPYKHGQMRKIFDAFVNMLGERAVTAKSWAS